MPVDARRIRELLREFRLKKLFNELGWDNCGEVLSVTIDGQEYQLQALAQKRGVLALQCRPDAVGRIPPRSTRLRIETQVARSVALHIIIFANADGSEQVWQWVKREVNKGAVTRELRYTRSQSGELLAQRLQAMLFTFEEEDDLSLLDVVRGVKSTFDVEKVTKRFYEDFRGEHAKFRKFLKGIPVDEDVDWYVSVMLNRLMFIYFIQKKGFLDGDPGYLGNRLLASMGREKDAFYRDFLLTLFFEGFAHPEAERSAAHRKLLGQVPYLNGGLFMKHVLEERYGGTISIADGAFEGIFKFFENYTWHLDDRPEKAGNEVNPDVLGYIFEKYINQKQMGAYYTKEDITGYICRNTILPFLFDKLADMRYAAVHPLPIVDVEPYIYDAVKQGDFLPTETERERTARHERLAALRADFRAGKIAQINDLVTYNLDIETFVKDWLADLTDPQTLRAFYFECLKKLTVLDPTAGSGAFLFAAMNILEPLYELCLDRMDALQDPKYPDFTKELSRVARHPNRQYFIYKSIIVHNLFGVDIMEEAVEICKLRLFLKLVAQVETAEKIEPLPDIDFNVRAGNTLVGYATEAEVLTAGSRSLFNLDLEQQIADARRGLAAFRQYQTDIDASAGLMAMAKQGVREQLRVLNGVLNEALANEYSMEVQDFVPSHQPFHWYVEFNGIMREGGFDVIVGNPPYVEYKEAKRQYQVRGYESLPCGNLYAFVIERSIDILQSSGRYGLIVPASLATAGAFHELRELMWREGPRLWLSHFANRPGQLFEGAQNRLTIVIAQKEAREPRAFSTRYYRWDARGGEREHLFSLLTYTPLDFLGRSNFTFPKIGAVAASGIVRKLDQQTRIRSQLTKNATNNVYWVRVPGYFCQFFLTPPKARPEDGGPERVRGEVLSVAAATGDRARILHAVLSSSTYFQFYCAYSDGRHINPSDVADFPFALDQLDHDLGAELIALSGRLESTLLANTKQWRKSRLLIDSVDSKAAKPIIDDIDRVLAQHYGFTDEELDFIINYDIKYRMGKDATGDDAGEED